MEQMKSLKTIPSRIYSTVRKKTSDFANWLLNYVPPIPGKRAASAMANRIYSTVRKKTSDFANWLFNYVPPIPEIRDNAHPFVIAALNNSLEDYVIEGREGYDPTSFLDAVRPLVIEILNNIGSTRVRMILICIMSRINVATGEVKQTIPPVHFTSNTEDNVGEPNKNKLYDPMVDRIKENLAAFQQHGSNWQFTRVVRLEIHTTRYNPLAPRGEGYIPLPLAPRGERYIPTPKYLAKKGAIIINPQNENSDDCFKWCITRHFHPVQKDPQRITEKLREQSEKYNWEGINFPVSLKDIKKFEEQNDISVHVLAYEKRDLKAKAFNEVYILIRSKRKDNDKKKDVILLLLKDDKGNQHYTLVKDMSKLCGSQISKHNGKMYFCMNCLNPSYTEKKLADHKEYCYNNEAVKCVYPKKGEKMYFKHGEKKMRVPFKIYADFEAFTELIDTCQPNPGASYTMPYQKHTPASFCYYVKCFDDEIYAPRTEKFTKEKDGDDVAKKFVDKLRQEVIDIYNF